jgi:hypothetical protein
LLDDPASRDEPMNGCAWDKRSLITAGQLFDAGEATTFLCVGSSPSAKANRIRDGLEWRTSHERFAAGRVTGELVKRQPRETQARCRRTAGYVPTGEGAEHPCWGPIDPSAKLIGLPVQSRCVGVPALSGVDNSFALE